MSYKVVVIGGGAAGFFGAITCAQVNPDVDVVLLEKTNKLLAKVLVSGGGRCNVTHNCFSPGPLSQHYPRGAKPLKDAFKTFGAQETVAWFEQRGVKLKTEADGRMFPVTDSSQTIADCLLQEARKAGVNIKTGVGVSLITPPDATINQLNYIVQLSNGTEIKADKVLICTGGNPKATGYDWLRELGHPIQEPVPSLFTFNVPGNPLKELMGVSVPHARVRIAGQKLEYEGPLLITHWGYSGPAVLKLSAWGARIFHDQNYTFTALINWIPTYTEESLRTELQNYRQSHPKKVVITNALFGLPQRLWKALTTLAEIQPETKWAELPAKNTNKLVEALLRMAVEVKGKSTFKEEFVTCGGIDLSQVNMKNMESRLHTGLYFAGEVLDIDGITGGFNFQAAWTTGFLAGSAMAAKL
ncbi:NAD(P)/FAD-dependent oxidoreductase [Pontibacter sp. BT310]|uniref:NAD(P)/FAD-dependent oxidoreductase n=1 Tax=Pontibacter populi TaxID=890055 RepID=A0ABS6XF27_9BACT|nr:MULTISPECIES: NAD(P)/FAD-dependent oxidoreductase [Pontibacter]MBJ6119736.1 NAD(P)/FAD-dependent oxidoreductase [Pontibacter sp. BT310]MBR0572165.1 NAD(P)/FAD-dependent oxidoreductase [Microvirga sp. STS03]MBW3366589.1 NAD(P)/FAD-dependent oxidoreductase [Pontibacter populi]